MHKFCHTNLNLLHDASTDDTSDTTDASTDDNVEHLVQNFNVCISVNILRRCFDCFTISVSYHSLTGILI